MNQDELKQLIQQVVMETLKQLNIGVPESKFKSKSKVIKPIEEKSAYAQTESLLYNYLNFKKIIDQKKREIEDIKKYGALQGGSAVVMYGGNKSGHPQGIVLDEERKASAINNIEKSMETTVQAIALIDSCMKTLVNDPYYKVLEMRYFEGRTQEDIAVEFNCSQQNIAYHKSRLVKELSIKLFPDKVVNEYFS